MYCIGSDTIISDDSRVIVLCFNGSDFFTPAVPEGLANAYKIWSQYIDTLTSLVELNTKMVNLFPKGTLVQGHKAVGKILKRTQSFLCSQSLISGSGEYELLLQAAHQIAGPKGKGKKRKLTEPAELASIEPDRKRTKRSDNVCYCGIQVEDPAQLGQHLTDIHPNSTNWVCSNALCCKKFSTSTNLWKHYRTIHLDLWLYTCGQCSKPGANSDEQSVVIKHCSDYHKGPTGGVPCRRCKKLFSTGTSMKKHLKGCGNKDKPHQCLVKDEEGFECLKRFRERSTLAHHKLVHHPQEGEEGRYYTCTHCPAQFEYPQGLKYHMETAKHLTAKRANPIEAVKEKADKIVTELYRKPVQEPIHIVESDDLENTDSADSVTVMETYSGHSDEKDEATSEEEYEDKLKREQREKKEEDDEIQEAYKEAKKKAKETQKRDKEQAKVRREKRKDKEKDHKEKKQHDKNKDTAHKKKGGTREK